MINDFAMLAQQGTELDPFNLIQYGILGILIVLIMFKKLVPGWTLTQKEEELVAKEEELRALRAKIEDSVLPAIIRSTDLLRRFAEEEQIKSILERNQNQ